MIATAIERWKQLSPVTRRLVPFAVVSCLAVNLVLSFLPWQARQETAEHYTRFFLERRDAFNDSWRPMRAALQHLDESPDSPLYAHVFFRRGVKFQYAPSSLLVLEPLKRSPFGDLTSNEFLNGVSWLCVLALALVVSRILVSSTRLAFAPGARQSRSDEILQMGLAFCFTLTFYPVVRAYYLGQIQVWIDLLFAGLVWAWLADRKRAAGLLCGVICAFKPTLALLAVWGLTRRQWTFVGGWALAAGAIGIVSLLVYGVSSHLDYLEVLSFIARHGESFHANQSVNGLLHRLLFNGNNVHWEPRNFAPYNAWVHAGTVATSLALVATALFWRARAKRAGESTDLLIAALSFTMAAPVVWEHHYGIALPVFAIALPATLAVPTLAARGASILALAYLVMSNHWALFNELAATRWNVLQSAQFLAALLLLFHLYRLRAEQESAEPAAP